MSYEYDIFVSYRRDPPVEEWVHEYFAAQLTMWLAASRPQPPRVFLDEKGIQHGDQYPQRLRRALGRSRLLIPVWSPDYFTSPWCVAELRTMLARERTLLLRTEDEPRGLVFPIKFSDGKFFPDYVGGITLRDFSDWAHTAPFFRSSEKFLLFEDAIKGLAERLAEIIDDVPPWDAAWPIETPPGPLPPVAPELLRLQ